MAEFTGERIIPGEVDPDLWNEHAARYAFARRFAAGRRVLDAGCGAGYGSSLLAREAASVAALDVGEEALAHAREHYAAPNLHFLRASCEDLPLGSGSVDLLVSFEVIEHLTRWESFLDEARRVLGGKGLFLVSTPNRDYYAESRRQSGPNPFHVHEFDHAEFEAALRARFPEVRLLVQNHAAGVVFQPPNRQAAELSVEDSVFQPGEANFFVALCSGEPIPEPPVFFFLPSSANLLRERERHIGKLEAELAAKNDWLERLEKEKQNLVDMFRAQTAELDRSNRWAQETDAKLRAAQERIAALQQELAAQQASALQAVAGYEAKIAELEQAHRDLVQLAETQVREYVQLLDASEKTVEERTRWAQRLDEELRQAEERLNRVRASRWVRLGQAIGLGPFARTRQS